MTIEQATLIQAGVALFCFGKLYDKLMTINGEVSKLRVWRDKASEQISRISAKCGLRHNDEDE